MKVEIQCCYCQKLFLREIKSVNQSKKLGYTNFYCSKECVNLDRITSIDTVCARCGTPITRRKSQVSKSKSGLVYCSHSCSRLNIPQDTFPSGEDHPNFVDGISSYRQRALIYYGAECSVCGYDILEVLEVHHRDKNRKHNDIENLDVLCPTHHTEYQLGIRLYP